jgi:hypothetical protein
MSGWILFLDDMRFPEDVRKHIGAHENIVICRSIDDAKWCVKNYGLPVAIHFDHDIQTIKHIPHNNEKGNLLIFCLFFVFAYTIVFYKKFYLIQPICRA